MKAIRISGLLGLMLVAGIVGAAIYDSFIPDISPAQAIGSAITALVGQDEEYWPTLDDYMIGVYQKYVNLTNLQSNTLEDQHRQYLVVYAAQECVNGRHLSPENFRAFVRQSVREETPSGGSVIGAAAKIAVNDMRDAIALRSGQSDLADDCLRPYMNPNTIEEVTRAIDLVLVVSSEGLAPRNRNNYMDFARYQFTYEWFHERNQDLPLMLWLCLKAGYCE